MHVVAVQARAARCAQRRVQHGPALGGVDGLAGEHGVALRFQAALARQVEQEVLRRGVDQVLGQVGEDLGRLQAEGIESPGVAREGLAQVQAAAVGLVVPLQGRPGGGAVAAVHRCASMSWSSFTASAAKARMPSDSFSVAIASSFRAQRKPASL